VRAIVRVKRAAAHVHLHLGLLDADRARAIQHAARRFMAQDDRRRAARVMAMDGVHVGAANPHRLDADQRLVLRGLEPHAVFVSAFTGEGIEELERLVAETIPDPDVEITAVIPYDHGELISLIHEHGQVIDTDYVESGTRIHARVSVEMSNRLAQYLES
jgi:50S ribosomal subunit-associated GTPase HflX